MRRLLCFGLVFAFGCTTPANRPGRLAIDGGPYVFDTDYDGGVKHVFVLRNTGDRGVSPLHVELLGDTRSFAITRNGCGESIAGGATCSIEVTLGGDSDGEYQAQLLAQGPEDDFAGVAMSGRVTPAQVEVQPQPSTIVRGSVGDFVVGIANAGGARSGKLAVSVDGASIAADACTGTTLAGGGSCFVSIAVASDLHVPVAPAPIVTVTQDDGSKASATLILTLVDPGKLTFDGLDLGDGDAHVYRPVIVRNPGPETTTPLHVTVSDLVGDPTLGFRVFYLDGGTCEGTRLAPKQTCTVIVGVDTGATHAHAYSAMLLVQADNIEDASGTVTAVFGSLARGTVAVSVFGAAGSGIVQDPNGVTVGPGGIEKWGLASGQSITLTAIAGNGSIFAGWSGGGCGNATSCTVTLDQKPYVSITARFE